MDSKKPKPDHAMQAFLASRFLDGFHKDDPAHREIVAAEYPAYLEKRNHLKTTRFSRFIDGVPAYELMMTAAFAGELDNVEELKKSKTLTKAQYEYLWHIGYYPRRSADKGHSIIGSHRLGPVGSEFEPI